MRTTLNLPDDLMKAVKILAVEQNKTLQEVIAELLRYGLESQKPRQRHRVRLPLVECAQSSVNLDPDTIAEILLAQELDGSL